MLALVRSRHGNVLKLPEPVFLVDTRLLDASLQDRLTRSCPRPRSQRRHGPPSIPAGSTRTSRPGSPLQQLGELLAHQSPPQSLLAISGSPGATLAGALATATHGAEFEWPLLIDTVKAVHLVGPGGVHWWIEGDTPSRIP